LAAAQRQTGVLTRNALVRRSSDDPLIRDRSCRDRLRDGGPETAMSPVKIDI